MEEKVFSSKNKTSSENNNLLINSRMTVENVSLGDVIDPDCQIDLYCDRIAF